MPSRGISLASINVPRLVAVTGLAFEARIAAGPGVTVVCGGGPDALRRSLEAAIGADRTGGPVAGAGHVNCQGILSFGIAGGLAADLKPGALVVARSVVAAAGRYPSDRAWAQSLLAMARRGGLKQVAFGDIAGVEAPAASVAVKRQLFAQTGAVAVDMESHLAARIAAEHGVPFAAFRVVTDPSDRALPPAALVATSADGGVDFPAVVRSLIARPGQLSEVIRLALDSWAARRALVPGRRFLGPNLGLPDLGEHLLDVA